MYANHDDHMSPAPARGGDREYAALPADLRAPRVMRTGGLPGGMDRLTPPTGAPQGNPLFGPAHSAGPTPLR